MEKVKNRVHCSMGFKCGENTYLLCGIKHQGRLQGFSAESFLKFERNLQCSKCLARIKKRKEVSSQTGKNPTERQNCLSIWAVWWASLWGWEYKTLNERKF